LLASFGKGGTQNVGCLLDAGIQNSGPAAELRSVGRPAPKISALEGILWLPSDIFAWSFPQRCVMAAGSIRALDHSFKVRIDLPKFAQNERIAGT
jgi:hypothetical protein